MYNTQAVLLSLSWVRLVASLFPDLQMIQVLFHRLSFRCCQWHWLIDCEGSQMRHSPRLVLCVQGSEYDHGLVVIFPYMHEECLWYLLQLLLLLSREHPGPHLTNRCRDHEAPLWLQLRAVHVLLLRGEQPPPQPRAHALLILSVLPLPAQGAPFLVEPAQEPLVALAEVTPRP